MKISTVRNLLFGQRALWQTSGVRENPLNQPVTAEWATVGAPHLLASAHSLKGQPAFSFWLQSPKVSDFSLLSQQDYDHKSASYTLENICNTGITYFLNLSGHPNSDCTGSQGSSGPLVSTLRTKNLNLPCRDASKPGLCAPTTVITEPRFSKQRGSSTQVHTDKHRS